MWRALGREPTDVLKLTYAMLAEAAPTLRTALVTELQAWAIDRSQPIELVSRAMTLYAVALSHSPSSPRSFASLYQRHMEIAAKPPEEDAIQRSISFLVLYEVRHRPICRPTTNAGRPRLDRASSSY